MTLLFTILVTFFAGMGAGLGTGSRLYNEFDAEKKRHEDGKIPHGGGRDKA